MLIADVPGEVTTLGLRSELPIGFEFITIAPTLHWKWWSCESGSMGPLAYTQLASIIEAKHKLLPRYRANLPNCPIWLLICSGPSIAEGVPIPDIDGWTFNFGFEKVLLLSGMDNQVLEIGHESRASKGLL